MNGITCCCGNLGDIFNARILVGLVTVGLAFALTSSVALVAENMMPDWPALLTLHAGIKDQAAVLQVQTHHRGIIQILWRHTTMHDTWL